MDRTVDLIDDDGAGDVVHDYVLEGDVGGGAGRGAWPRLDSNSVRGADHRAVPHPHPGHVLLLLVLPQAPDTDRNNNEQ